jgi:histone-lysine N-methyltransferase SUV420H
MIITELKGSMADLTPEEEHRLKHGDPRGDGLGIRRDFSVIHSRAKKMNHLFLGPARFVNVSIITIIHTLPVWYMLYFQN